VQCAWEYQKRLFWFFVMGWVQLGLGVTGAAMAWRWFRGVVMVFGPTVVSLTLLVSLLVWGWGWEEGGLEREKGGARDGLPGAKSKG
jgi:hypothetical protein